MISQARLLEAGYTVEINKTAILDLKAHRNFRIMIAGVMNDEQVR